jgi:hypothetical protein
MNETAHAPKTSPMMAVTELFKASPRLTAGVGILAAALLVVAAGASIG